MSDPKSNYCNNGHWIDLACHSSEASSDRTNYTSESSCNNFNEFCYGWHPKRGC